MMLYAIAGFCAVILATIYGCMRIAAKAERDAERERMNEEVCMYCAGMKWRYDIDTGLCGPCECSEVKN